MKLATHIDAYISATHPDIKPNFISNAIKESETCKARLLHYFPLEVGDELIQLVKTKDHHNLQEDIDSWCGLHIDHSMVTNEPAISIILFLLIFFLLVVDWTHVRYLR